MKIPKRFNLHGQTIEVVEDPLMLFGEDVRGLAEYRFNRIKIQPSVESNPCPQTQVEQSFCHELVHFLFHASGYDTDQLDEVKVERISKLLHQAMTTMEYGE